MHSICNLKYSVPKKILLAFPNGSSYDYHFIVKELTEEIRKQFTCLGENTEKHITFAVPRIDENREEIPKKYILHITIY